MKIKRLNRNRNAPYRKYGMKLKRNVDQSIQSERVNVFRIFLQIII